MTDEISSTAAGAHYPAKSGEWLRFWKIVFLATVLPFLILIGCVETLGWSLGETSTAESLIHALARDPTTVWMVFRSEAGARLKMAQIARESPDVLIIGHSRVGQFRASMFKPYTFYNLSRVSWPFDTYTTLLRHLPEGYRPKLIIFSADFFMFDDKYKETHSGIAPVFGHALSEHVIQLEQVGKLTFLHPQLLWKRTDYDGHPARGILAIMTGDAYRNDGSEQHPGDEMPLAGRSAENLMKPIWKEHVTEGEKMGEAQMADLKVFIDLGKSMGIPMAAVQMPIYGPVAWKLEADPHYRVLADFRRHVANGYFKNLGIPFFDYMYFPPYSDDYRYFYDAVHPSEPLTAAVLQAMASDPRVHALLPRLDMEALRQLLKADHDASQHILLEPAVSGSAAGA